MSDRRRREKRILLDLSLLERRVRQQSHWWPFCPPRLSWLYGIVVQKKNVVPSRGLNLGRQEGLAETRVSLSSRLQSAEGAAEGRRCRSCCDETTGSRRH
ncbi:hypothetical protein H6P81_012663 [Aristolochia fimbriata]|uniref:Uncharacterized protein n=1 Tax=Aristolochia fimbriata TaxID=158543 RepID=A0AAV7ECF1_ARIFI|nr:hypothetical protein H6P81_012663 [Aristolochia fimbriata]